MSKAKSDLKSAGILIIGAELLSGKVQDENGIHLIQGFRRLGIEVAELRIIQDAPSSIAGAVAHFHQRYDHVVTTGGVGPTHDDLTMRGVAQAFDVRVIQHPMLIERIREKWPETYEDKLRLAEVPEGASVTMHENGFLPIVQMQNVLVLPGIPSFMRTIFDAVSKGWSQASFVSDALEFEASESKIADALSAVQDAHPSVALGSYPRLEDGRWLVRITLDGRDEEAVAEASQAVLAAFAEARIKPL